MGVVICLLATACSQPASQSSGERQVESEVVVWQTRVERSLAPALETSGAVIASVGEKPNPAPEETATVVAVDLPLTAALDERDVYRAIAAVHDADRDGPVDVVFTRLNQDGTTKITVFFWSPDGTISRSEGRGVRKGGPASATRVGRVSGVFAEMIRPIATGKRPVPKLEPMPPATD